MEYRVITEKYFEEAFLINKEYLSASKEAFRKWYTEYPNLFVGAFDDEKLIGICYGFDSKDKDYVLLEGIATIFDYWRKGIGSDLLKKFEQQVKKREKKFITLGCASDEKTEKFYLKNDYKPTMYLARIKKKDLPASYESLTKGYDFIEKKDEDDSVKLYFKAEQYDIAKRIKLQKQLNAYEVIYIMEKALH